MEGMASLLVGDIQASDCRKWNGLAQLWERKAANHSIEENMLPGVLVPQANSILGRETA
jgi:hypothetical protein